MKTRIELKEESFPSLPHVGIKCFQDGEPIDRAEFTRVKCSLARVLSDETHSAGGKTVRHILGEIAS